jgi:hypothetical protein
VDPDLKLDPNPHSSKRLDSDLHIMNAPSKTLCMRYFAFVVATFFRHNCRFVKSLVGKNFLLVGPKGKDLVKIKTLMVLAY